MTSYRPISIRCSWGFHNTDEVDSAGRRSCSRCGFRERKRHAPIPNPDFEGRQLTRPRTKGER